MEQDKNKDLENQKNTTDPQQNEIDGNVFGKVFEKLVGDSEGDNSLSEDELKDPKNDESIKTDK